MSWYTELLSYVPNPILLIDFIVTSLVAPIYALFEYFLWFLTILVASFFTIYVVATALIMVFSYDPNPNKLFSNIFNNLISFNSRLLMLFFEIVKITLQAAHIIVNGIVNIIPFT